MSSPKDDPVRDAADSLLSGEPDYLKSGCDSSPTALVDAGIDRVDPSFGPAMDVPGIFVMGHTCCACGQYTPKIRCTYCGWVGDYTGMVSPGCCLYLDGILLLVCTDETLVGYPPTPY